MCKLEIQTKIPEGKDFCIEIDNQKRYLDQFTDKIDFELSQGEYTVNITQQYKSTYNKIGWWIFYILTIPFRAILNVIFLNTEDELPDLFLMRATYKIHIMEDENLLELSLIEENERRKGLKIDFPNSQEINLRFDFNRERLADYFYDYIKRLFSVVLLCEVLFAVLLYQGIVHKNTLMAVICAVVLTAVIVLCTFLTVKKRLYVNQLRKTYDI